MLFRCTIASVSGCAPGCMRCATSWISKAPTTACWCRMKVPRRSSGTGKSVRCAASWIRRVVVTGRPRHSSVAATVRRTSSGPVAAPGRNSPEPPEPMSPEPALGVYIHVPFCSAICNYCNFNRGLFDESLKTRFVDALLREIDQAPSAAADTLYFGGGTPSLLTPGEIELIVAAARSAFDLTRDAEI